jgi:hypothetical protein
MFGIASISSIYSGYAKNLHDPCFGEKAENFRGPRRFGEHEHSDLLSIYANTIAGKASGTAHLRLSLHSGKIKIFGCSVTLLVERLELWSNFFTCSALSELSLRQ